MMRMRTRLVILPCLLVVSGAYADWQVPRTTDGHPNLQGIWHYGSGTPFERPPALGNKRVYTDEEARSEQRQLFKSQEQLASPSDPDRGAPAAGAEIGNEADQNFVGHRTNMTVIAGKYRTSLIVDPPNGRFPYRAGVMDLGEKRLATGHGGFDGPEIRPPSERCLNAPGPMPPMVGWTYNANMRIVQTDKYVVIAAEMPFSPRIIPFANEFPLYGFPSWMGQSIGRWDGDTLVVRTRYLRPDSSREEFRMSDDMQVVERFTRISTNEIFYRYTVTDPKMYTQPMTVEMSMTLRRPGEHIYEFACHEGNYSLRSILAGARRVESQSVRGPAN